MLQSLPSRFQITQHAYRQPEGTPRCAPFGSTQEVGLVAGPAPVNSQHQQPAEKGIQNRYSDGYSRNKNSSMFSGEGILDAPELAKSRLPEYKEVGANSSTSPADQVATTCFLHAVCS